MPKPAPRALTPPLLVPPVQEPVPVRQQVMQGLGITVVGQNKQLVEQSDVIVVAVKPYDVFKVRGGRVASFSWPELAERRQGGIDEMQRSSRPRFLRPANVASRRPLSRRRPFFPAHNSAFACASSR